MTNIFTFSGVHGGGKTTLINHIANRLTNIGYKVFVLQEFPYIPDIPIGTMDFQAWYQNAMEQRGDVVKLLYNREMFDIILLDRHPLDVEIYTSRLLDNRISPTNIKEAVETMHRAFEKGSEWTTYHPTKYEEYTGMFVFERSIDDLLISLKTRLEKEEHRKEWGEFTLSKEDTEYLNHIIETFRLFKENPNVIFIENKVLDDTKDLVFEHIMQRLKNE